MLSDSKLIMGGMKKSKSKDLGAGGGAPVTGSDGSSSAPNEKTKTSGFLDKSSSEGSIQRKSNKNELSNHTFTNMNFDKKKDKSKSPASLSPDKPHHSILPVVNSPHPNSKTASPVDPMFVGNSMGAVSSMVPPMSYAGSPALR